MKGKFISLEGIDGSGKSTAVQVVTSHLLEAHGIHPLQTREPGSTPIGERIRSFLLSSSEESVRSVKSEFLLMYAARQENIRMNIFPALNKGRWVLSDRFHDSTYSYQGAHHINPEDKNTYIPDVMFVEMEQMIVVDGYCMPDLTILLDLPADKALTRLSNRKMSFFESLGTGYMERVRQRYLSLASDTDRIVVIDSYGPMKKTHEKIKEAIDAFVDKVRGVEIENI